MVLLISELKRYAFVRGIRHGNIRIFLDYVQDKFLFYLAEFFDFSFFWKGGTLLFKYYGSGRFSEDLDLGFLKKFDISPVFDALQAEGFIIDRRNIRSTGNVIYAKLWVSHPIDKTRVILRINASLFAKKHNLHKITFISPYPDVPPCDVLIVDVESIIRDKVDALVHRKKPRDFYDIYFILRKYKLKIQIDKDKKQDIYSALKSIENTWRVLREYVLGSLPKFEEARNVFLRSIVWV